MMKEIPCLSDSSVTCPYDKCPLYELNLISIRDFVTRLQRKGRDIDETDIIDLLADPDDNIGKMYNETLKTDVTPEEAISLRDRMYLLLNEFLNERQDIIREHHLEDLCFRLNPYQSL